MRVAWAIPLAAMLWNTRAEACGCFTPPSTTTPVVQAGERILFAHEGNQVIAYIQIQYQGSADNFGWIVKKDEEGRPGRVDYAATESGVNAPELRITFE